MYDESIFMAHKYFTDLLKSSAVPVMIIMFFLSYGVSGQIGHLGKDRLADNKCRNVPRSEC